MKIAVKILLWHVMLVVIVAVIYYGIIGPLETYIRNYGQERWIFDEIWCKDRKCTP